MMMRFPLYKRIPERVLREILLFFVACFPSAVLIQAVNVNTRVGNGRGQGDLFPSTHAQSIRGCARNCKAAPNRFGKAPPARPAQSPVRPGVSRPRAPRSSDRASFILNA